jgi:hypothetical protein
MSRARRGCSPPGSVHSTRTYYEFFVSANGAIAPGEFIDIDLASVDQNLSL